MGLPSLLAKSGVSSSENNRPSGDTYLVESSYRFLSNCIYDLIRMYAALGNRTRYEFLYRLVYEGGLTPQELEESFGINPSTIRYHLHRNAGYDHFPDGVREHANGNIGQCRARYPRYPSGDRSRLRVLLELSSGPTDCHRGCRKRKNVPRLAVHGYYFEGGRFSQTRVVALGTFDCRTNAYWFHTESVEPTLRCNLEGFERSAKSAHTRFSQYSTGSTHPHGPRR